MTDTPLDRAVAAMEAAPEDEAARLAFYDLLAHAELVLLLAEAPRDDRIEPVDAEIAGTPCLLAFDGEERLAAHAGAPAPYAALSGRALASMLRGQGLGLALNPGTPHAHLLPPEAVDWLAATLEQGPEELAARPTAFHQPDLPGPLLEALDRRLASAAGLARAAHLCGVTYADGSRGHLLAVTGARPGAEPALAGAVNDAMAFSGAEEVALDVTFLADDDPALARLAAHALRFDLPAPAEPRRHSPAAPGTDPDRPPKLR